MNFEELDELDLWSRAVMRDEDSSDRMDNNKSYKWRAQRGSISANAAEMEIRRY
jgi:hypothetical protein